MMVEGYGIMDGDGEFRADDLRTACDAMMFLRYNVPEREDVAKTLSRELKFLLELSCRTGDRESPTCLTCRHGDGRLTWNERGSREKTAWTVEMRCRAGWRIAWFTTDECWEHER